MTFDLAMTRKAQAIKEKVDTVFHENFKNLPFKRQLSTE